jgi:hypothetical protein
MVGIVGILLLGSLAWSAVGALASAIGAAASAIPTPGRPQPTLVPVIAATPAVVIVLPPTPTPADDVAATGEPTLSAGGSTAPTERP